MGCRFDYIMWISRFHHIRIDKLLLENKVKRNGENFVILEKRIQKCQA